MINICAKCKSALQPSPSLIFNDNKAISCRKECTCIIFDRNKIMYYHLPVLLNNSWYKYRESYKYGWAEIHKNYECIGKNLKSFNCLSDDLILNKDPKIIIEKFIKLQIFK